MRYLTLYFGVFIGCYILGAIHANNYEQGNPLLIIFIVAFSVVVYIIAFIMEGVLKHKYKSVLSAWQMLIIGATYVPVFFLVYGSIGMANIQYLAFMSICSILINPYTFRIVFNNFGKNT